MNNKASDLEQMFADAEDVQRMIVAIRNRWGITVTREYAEALLKFVLELNAYVAGLEEEIRKLRHDDTRRPG